jgi:hypothetical protein
MQCQKRSKRRQYTDRSLLGCAIYSTVTVTVAVVACSLDRNVA